MRFILVAIAFIISNYSIAQKGWQITYKVTSDLMDTTGTLVVLASGGNSSNTLSSDRDGKVHMKSIHLKKDTLYFYDYLGDGYSNLKNFHRTETREFENYEVIVLGEETWGELKCTKISLKTDDASSASLMWIADIPVNSEELVGTYIFIFNLLKLRIGLKKLNLTGFPVKIQYSGYREQTYEFIKAKPVTLSDSMFKVHIYEQERSAETHNKENKVSEEQYKQMKIEEENLKKKGK